jgi:hypothetical protein
MAGVLFSVGVFDVPTFAATSVLMLAVLALAA